MQMQRASIEETPAAVRREVEAPAGIEEMAHSLH